MLKKITVLGLLLSVFIAPISYAHFHYTINSTATLQSNEKKQLTAVAMSWVYDEEVSGIMLRSDRALDDLATDVMNDLLKLDYFTRLEFNGKAIATKKVSNYKLEKITRDKKNLLKLNFVLPLKSPLYLQGNNTLRIIHTDAGASASLFYRNTNHIILGANFASFCTPEVKAIKGFENGEAPEIVNINCIKK